MKALLFAVMLASPAFAQKEVWSAELPPLPNGSVRTLEVVATDKAGNTCVIFGELEEADVGGGYRVFDRFVMISAKGARIFDRRTEWLAGSEETAARLSEIAGTRPPADPWRILSVVGSTATVVGQRRVVVLAAAKPEVFTQQFLGDDEVAIPLATTSVYKGWVKAKSIYATSFVVNSQPVAAFKVTRLSLWSIK